MGKSSWVVWRRCGVLACQVALAACGGDSGSGPGPTTGTISGQVTDASTSQPITGATVTTQPATSSATTDAQGNYSIANVNAGGYTVGVAKTDYQVSSVNVTVSPGLTVTANVSLTLQAALYAGQWTGTTSQNLPLYFRINQAGQIDSLTARLRLNFLTFTCTATFPATPPIAISNSQFDAFLSNPITNVTTTLRGQFSNTSTASGSWDAWTQSASVVCGNTIGFVSGGALGAGTWTATKQ